MSFDKFINKAKKLANDPKVREKLNSEKVEKYSDSILDKAAGAADSLTKGKHSDKIRQARDAADRAIGSDGAGSGSDGSGSGSQSGRTDAPKPAPPRQPSDSAAPGDSLKNDEDPRSR